MSFKNEIQPIFTDNCVICHQGGSPPAGMSLDPAMSYNNLVNVQSVGSKLMRVFPGFPDKSYILNKLTGTQLEVGGVGAQMPYNNQPLPQEIIDQIRRWISEGAVNN